MQYINFMVKIVKVSYHFTAYLTVDINNIFRGHIFVNAKQDHINVQEDGPQNDESVEVGTGQLHYPDKTNRQDNRNEKFNIIAYMYSQSNVDWP